MRLLSPTDLNVGQTHSIIKRIFKNILAFDWNLTRNFTEFDSLNCKGYKIRGYCEGEILVVNLDC